MDEDPAMDTVRVRFEKSKLTLDQLGEKMGYPPASARKSAWQFIHKTNDPRLSMLRKFAEAVGVKVSATAEGLAMLPDHRTQFSLRSLLWLTTIVAVVVGSVSAWSYHARRVEARKARMRTIIFDRPDCLPSGSHQPPPSRNSPRCHPLQHPLPSPLAAHLTAQFP